MIRGLAINFAVAIVVTLIVYPLAYRAGRHSALQSADAKKAQILEQIIAARNNYAKEIEAWKQRSARWQRDYDAFMLKQKELSQ